MKFKNWPSRFIVTNIPLAIYANFVPTDSAEEAKKNSYSVFEHVVAGLNCSPETLVLIVTPDPLSLYCDASGNEREPITVVGGVLATVQDWIAFRPEWNDALVIDGIKVFHANEYAYSQGEFAHLVSKQARQDPDSNETVITVASAHISSLVADDSKGKRSSGIITGGLRVKFVDVADPRDRAEACRKIARSLPTSISPCIGTVSICRVPLLSTRRS